MQEYLISQTYIHSYQSFILLFIFIGWWMKMINMLMKMFFWWWSSSHTNKNLFDSMSWWGRCFKFALVRWCFIMCRNFYLKFFKSLLISCWNDRYSLCCITSIYLFTKLLYIGNGGIRWRNMISQNSFSH